MRRVIAASAATAALSLPLVLSTPASAADDASVVVVHGVPGLTVDVYGSADDSYSADEALLQDFEPGTVTDPVSLPGGTYNLAVFPAGGDPSGDPAIEATGVEVPAGANISVVAHLNADGDPVLTPFVNDVDPVAAGEARIVVRHTAAAPAVDILAGGEPVFTGLTNPNEDSADLPTGSVSAAVALAGTTDPVIGPADLDLAEGTSTIVYAYGSAEDDTLALAVQTIGGLHSSPSGVPSGTADLPADRTPFALTAIAVIALAAAGATGLRAKRTRA
ncbi:DUF4397 domain-containing protein [Phycicoccus sonneratiae]|uniref:DUF4397 domain-containing protein n=1 Tax=Phycicoccus sonneratiae TaxID=2807628 RepID=A0ABS2CT41_9MICO|nr:DUF4397 domain-containing protein [Phycicoccus sonneraticus]MBM6402279.1 DUF4397 domain-containing protein [Phycicoccus sonneraticus]